ncbi:hypothetical protein AYK24_00780 [Thermoplasmatales archaeon SG8-52-4]|nr:MAG: hypothetical protein AYK24_00780 [Thermoplasmatales archaeon SG8-52-4]
MKENKCYENYPLKFVIGAIILQLAINLIGAYIIYLIGLVWLILYLIFVLILEIRLLKISCIHCYYYNKRCAFGKGKLCSLFFKKGNPKKFIEKKIGWKDIIPDFMVSLIPLVVGIALIIINFNLILLILVVFLVLLAFPVNGFLRGSIACKHCKQRELGCPAEKLFNKKKSSKDK